MFGTTTSTVTINAAFLQEIKEDHRLLREYLDRTVALLSRPRLAIAEPSLLVDLLGRVRDQVAMHFALEEAYGYFQEAVSIAPQLNGYAEQLLAQHHGLYTAIRDVCEDAELLLYEKSKAAVFKRVKGAFSLFYDSFEEHEARENALIMQAFEEDLGAGD